MRNRGLVRLVRGNVRAGLLVAVASFATAGVAWAEVEEQNLAQLTTLARDIFVGRIVEVRDGMTPENVPFTEVTVELEDTLKGDLSGRYTFRQFGLLEPRPGPDGLTNLMVTPSGWPTYTTGHDVMLFLYEPARRTGLRTTVGLTQGAFRISAGAIISQAGNRGLLAGLDLPPARRSRVARLESRGPRAAIDAPEFIDLVRAAVRERWFEVQP